MRRTQYSEPGEERSRRPLLLDLCPDSRPLGRYPNNAFLMNCLRAALCLVVKFRNPPSSFDVLQRLVAVPLKYQLLRDGERDGRAGYGSNRHDYRLRTEGHGLGYLKIDLHHAD